MNNETKLPPAFPHARAKRLSAKKTIWLITFFIILIAASGGGLLSAIMGHLDAKTGRPVNFGYFQWWPWVVAVFGGTLGIWFGRVIWNNLDEMARRAHLDAFYWGGSGGIAIALPFALMPIKFPAAQFGFVEQLTHSSTHAFSLGIAATLLVIFAGYGLVWLTWWAIKR